MPAIQIQHWATNGMGHCYERTEGSKLIERILLVRVGDVNLDLVDWTYNYERNSTPPTNRTVA